jgi:hypothetical protein
MLKGGEDAFDSLKGFLQPMTIADFNNLMNMDYCGIFAMRWKNKNHVFQARLGRPLGKNKDFKKHTDNDSSFLTSYNSPFGRNKDEVREENLDRSYQMIEQSMMNADYSAEPQQGEGEADWDGIKKVGMRDRKSRKSR